MAADNKGFLYESKINNLLKKYKIQSSSFIGAGSDANAPDAEMVIKGVKYKVEVKLNLRVDFGQGSLDYDVKSKKWLLGGANTDSAQQMRDFLNSIKVPKIVNEAWGSSGAPRKFTVPLSKFTPADVKHDYAKFTDRFVIVNSDAVTNYYASKQTYYIQVGKYGLFYMGEDVAELGVPEFKPILRLRIRLKRGGSNPIYNYRFTTALQATSLNISNIDLESTKDLTVISARSKK